MPSSTLHIAAFIVWFVLMLGAFVFGAIILDRRGRRGRWYAFSVVLGVVMMLPAFQPQLIDPAVVIMIFPGVLLVTIGLLGVRRPSVPKGHCAECGYDFTGETDTSSTRCPECGTPRPGMQGHCLECRGDLTRALAGGSIVCPHCGAEIPPDRGGKRR